MTMLVLSNKVSASVVAGTNAVGFAPSHAYVRVERAVSQILVVNTSDDIDDGARIVLAVGPCSHPQARFTGCPAPKSVVHASLGASDLSQSGCRGVGIPAWPKTIWPIGATSFATVLPKFSKRGLTHCGNPSPLV